MEITYLTVAYDWYLFGHNLSDRISKGEEILFFCFYFIKFITSDEFCTDFSRRRAPRTRTVSDHFADLMEESTITTITNSSNYMGSLTSINSTSSIGSVRSGGVDAPPPKFFETDIDMPDSVYARTPPTPPTLTNSEEGEAFLQAAGDDDSSIETLIGFGSHKSASSTSTCCFDDSPTKEKENKPPSPSSRSDPLEIPNTNGHAMRSRSVTLDGWQVVSETGSVRDGVMPRGYYSPEASGSHESSSSGQSGSSTKSPLLTRSRSNSRNFNARSARKEKLQAVRVIFYNAYSAVVGFRFKNGSDNTPTGLSQLVQHFSTGYSGRITAPH